MKKLFAIGPTIICAVAAMCALGSPQVAEAQVLKDNFNDNLIDSCLWGSTHGSGITVAETNQRLEISIPGTTTGSIFGAGYGSNFLLNGNFDVQVDYKLLTWPLGSGVRVGLGIPDSPGSAVERTGFGSASDYPGEPRDVYLTHFQDGVNGIVATADLSGKLRLNRTGSTLTGYYWDGSSWVAIHAGPGTTSDVNVGLSAWSHDYAFTDQDVKIAFDNFQVNSGHVLGHCVPEPGVAALAVGPMLAGLAMFVARRRRKP